MQCIDKLALPVAETAWGVENSVKPLAHATQGRPSVGNPGGGGGGVAEAIRMPEQGGTHSLPKLPFHPVRQLLSLQRRKKTSAFKSWSTMTV